MIILRIMQDLFIRYIFEPFNCFNFGIIKINWFWLINTHIKKSCVFLYLAIQLLLNDWCISIINSQLMFIFCILIFLKRYFYFIIIHVYVAQYIKLLPNIFLIFQYSIYLQFNIFFRENHINFYPKFRNINLRDCRSNFKYT